MSIDRQKVIDSAQKYAAKGQLDKAIAEYLRVVKEDPSDVRVLLKIADLQVRKGDKNDAIATYSRVANAYEQQQDYQKAIAVFKQVLSIDPNLTELYLRLAELYGKLKLVPEALAHYDAVAQRYERAGQAEKLLKVFGQMVEVAPSNPALHIRLAEKLAGLNKIDDASVSFHAAAKILREMGRIDDWAKVGERMLFFKPGDVALAHELAQHYLQRQDAKRALPKLQVCFKANPRDVDILEMLASAFNELGQGSKTIAVYREIARIHQDAGAGDKRVSALKRVLELAPGDPEASAALKELQKPAARRSVPPAARGPIRRSSVSALKAVEAEDAEVELVEDEPSRPAAVLPAARPPVKPVAPPPPPAPRAPPPPANPRAAPPPANAREEAAPIPLARPLSVRPTAPSVPPPPPPDATALPEPSPEVVKIIGEADIFYKYGLKQKALLHLHKALELDGTSVDVLVRLRDLYEELGDPGNSARCSYVIASVYATIDPPTALAEVTRSLQIDPEQADAIELYQALGGEMMAAEEAPQETHEAAVEEQPEDPYAAYAAAVQSESQAAHDSEGLPHEVEEGLEEAEFFVSQGLYDDARDTLQGLLASYPQNPLLVERLEELEALLQSQSGGGDDQFALAEKLAEEVQSSGQGPSFGAGQEMIDVETVFAQFKKGVERTVSADDADTHYDLGIAYKEMGLLDDAMQEFAVAANSPRRQCVSETMIGLCCMEKGDPAGAVAHFKVALAAPGRGEREELGLYFELGNSYEALTDKKEALYYFQKVEKRDPRFRGVSQRVAGLLGQLQGSVASSDADEVDRAFDELMKG